MTVLLATTNAGKRAEFRALLPLGTRLVTLDEAAIKLPPEVGQTFRANADAKAVLAASASGLLTLADDSGLEARALGGAPGVRSARFAGDDATDAVNRAALLAAMEEIDDDRRGARFVCAVTLAAPDGVIARADGVCEGRIARAARGGFGFGYDPVFLLADDRTMAELPPAEKNRVSHRAAAYRRILPFLLDALDGPPRWDDRP